MAVLGQALDRVASGQSAVALIEGEAGIGKTRLLDEALRAARGRSMQVAAGRAEELERTRPFGLVADAFGCIRSSPDPRRMAIAEMLAGGGGDQGPITVTSDPGLRFQVIDAFADLAEEMALCGPLVIGADDLQWADPSSLVTLAALSRRLAYFPVALIGCLRPWPRRPELDRLAGALAAAGARHLILRGLADDAVSDLVAEVVAAVPGRGLLARMAGAAGNPLFVTELLGALTQEGAIETASGRAEAAEVPLPPTLRLTILRRISFMPEDTLLALRAASVLGSGFSLTDLAAVTGRPSLDLSVALENAIRASVLQDDGVRLLFRHDLIRDSIYQDLPASMRRALHREAGLRLAQAGAPALQVAEHLARGATSGDTETITWLARAAREAAARSPDVAADLLARAVGLMPATDPGRDRMLAEQASSLMLSGRIAEAETACRDLLGRPHDESVEGTVRICLGHALLAQGQAGEALRELERAGACPALTGTDRAAASAWASYARLALGDLDGASASAEKARSTAASAGDHLSASIAMASLGLVSEFHGHLRDGLRIIDDAVRLADESPGRLGHRYPLHAIRGWLLVECDRLDEARASIAAGRRICEELGVRWSLPFHQMFGAYERFVAGEWDDAIAELEAGFELADEIGETYSRMYAHGVLSLIRFHRNDLSGARDAADAAERDLADRSPGYRMTLAAWPSALISEADGQPARALAIMSGAWDTCVSSGLALEYPAVGADLVRLLLALGYPDRARDVSAAVSEVASANEVPWITGSALRCQGLIEGDAETLEAAAAAYARGSRRLQGAFACEDAGAAYSRHGHIGHARPLLERAIGVYERLGATRDLARVEAALREAGIRRGRRGPRDRPQFGWRSLTPAEQAIATLVAQGLSNPQIGDRLYVSRRTVQTHLAHVFTKLDITSRAQLAAAVTQHGAGQPGG
jgi:DNA-binding CsgD family transcriptional regulator